MKICMVISTPFPPEEGIGYYTYNLSKKLIDKGHEIIVITRGSWNEIQEKLIEDIKVIKAPFLPLYPFYLHIHGVFVNKIFKSIEEEVDILHFHTPLPPFIKTNLPIITTIHTPMLTDSKYIKSTSIYYLSSKISARFISYPLEIKLLHSSDIITTVSKSVAQELKKYYYLDSKKIIVVGNGVDEKFFHPADKNLEDDKKYIMFAGRIDREKGLFDLIEGAGVICKDRSDVSFIIAGRGRDSKKLQQKIKKLNLQDRFILTGQVEKDQLPKLYQKSSIFILPSYHEGLSGALLEAMSCGLPVIATDVRGNRDIIHDKRNGILIPPRSPKIIAKTISMLLDDEELRRKLGENARRTIEKEYTWDVISNKFLKYYESLIEGRKT